MRSMQLACSAESIVYCISGLFSKGTRFFLGMLLDPPRAGINAILFKDISPVMMLAFSIGDCVADYCYFLRAYE